MAMSISQPYRGGQRGAQAPSSSGYQNSKSSGGAPVNKAANDNIPRPANDNSPTVRTVPNFGRRGTARLVTRGVVFAARRSPWGRYLNLAQTVVETGYDMYRWREKRNIIETFGYWCLKRQCNPGSFNMSLDKWIGGPGGCAASGTVCLSQGAAFYYDLPVAPKPQFANAWPPGFLIGGMNTFAGGLSPYQWWGQNAAAPSPRKGPWISVAPHHWVQPRQVPIADPWFLPIGQPVPTPRRSPTPGYPVPGTPPTPEVSTGSYGSTTVYPKAGPRPQPQTRPKPPGPGEKERKGAARQAVATLARIAFAASEWVDMIDAIYEALPKKLRKTIEAKDKGRGMTPQDKALAIYANADQIDLNQMVLNILANQFEDAVIGRASAATDPWLQSRGVSGFGNIGNIG